jgi:hypothetical protein
MDTWNTGISAFGYIRLSGTQAPWSKPRLELGLTVKPALRNRFTACLATSGAPDAGYLISYKSRGNPPKSWMVSGRSARLTAGPPMLSQCADTTRMAPGVSLWVLHSVRNCLAGLFSIAIIGEPCDTKRLGIVFISVLPRRYHPEPDAFNRSCGYPVRL